MMFRKIYEADKPLIDSYLARTNYPGSDYSMLYLSGWDFFDFGGSMEIAEANGAVYIRFLPNLAKEDEETDSRGFVYMPPLTETGNFAAATDALREYCLSAGQEFYVTSCRPEEYALLDGNVYAIDEKNDSRDFAEYLYKPSDLITLPGKKYHAKRNFISRFTNTYQGKYVFRSFEERDRRGVYDLFGIWSRNKSFDGYHDSSKNQEARLVAKALDYVTKYDDFFADVIEIDGEIVGFEMGERLASNNGIVHIEKGNIEYDGVYPTLCQAFAAKHFADVNFINRQEDMGLDGLRKSKLSYHPCGFVEKRIIVLREAR